LEQKLSKNSNIEKILFECEQGSELHQEMLYKHFYGYAMSICRLYTYSIDEAVSILNDSFLKVFTSLENKSFNSSLPFKSWLRRILINTAIDNHRKNSKHYYHLEVEEVDMVIADTNCINNLNVEDILKLLDQLPETHRMVFNLYEIQGFSHAEIAIKLSIAESTSRVVLTRAKKRLRVLFNESF